MSATLFALTGNNKIMAGLEQGGEVMQESEAEAKFKEALQEFKNAQEDKDLAEEALDKAQEAAEEIEDEERRKEALDQVETLRQGL